MTEGTVVRHEDFRLVQRLIRGDEAAFNAFFDEYFPRLFRFALSRLRGDRDLAEELTQAALAKAVVRLESYRGEAALFSWLCTFCRREIARYVDRERRDREAFPPFVADVPAVRDALEAVADEVELTPEDVADRAELAELIRAVLGTLPLRYSQALQWKYLEDLSVREIARRLGLSAKAAESTLTRARVAFRTGFETATQAWQVSRDGGTA